MEAECAVLTKAVGIGDGTWNACGGDNIRGAKAVLAVTHGLIIAVKLLTELVGSYIMLIARGGGGLSVSIGEGNNGNGVDFADGMDGSLHAAAYLEQSLAIVP